MSAEENKAIVRRHFEEVWNKGDLAVVDEIYGPDISYQREHVTRAEWKNLLLPWRIGLPDFRYHLEQLVAEGDLVAANARMTGTHQGVFHYRHWGHYSPELCRGIASRHRGYLEAQGARFRTRLRERVRDAAIALTHRGLHPSASHIADLIGDRNVMRSHTAQAAWREVLSELGWQHDWAAGAADDLLTLLATSRQEAAKFQTLTSSADQ